MLDEVFNANNGSDDAKFIHIKTASGQTGYIQGSVTTENYSNEINGTVKSGYTNIREKVQELAMEKLVGQIQEIRFQLF